MAEVGRRSASVRGELMTISNPSRNRLFLFRVVAIDNLILKFPPPSLDETLNRVAGAFTQPPPKATTAFEPWNFEA